MINNRLFPVTFDPARAISAIAAVLVAILAALAFVLSYSSLRHVAAQHGIEGWLAYLWPLLLDFAMIVFSLAILRANLRGEPARYPWALTIGFAALAVAANVLDAAPLGVPPVVVAGSVKALAPIALVLAFELLMGMIRAEVNRTAAVATLADLAHQVDKARRDLAHVLASGETERESLAAEVAGLASKREELVSDIVRLRRELADVKKSASGPVRKSVMEQSPEELRANLALANEARELPTQDDFDRAAALKNEGLTWPEVAETLGKSVTTAKRWAAQAGEPVRSANGHGEGVLNG